VTNSRNAQFTGETIPLRALPN